MVKQTSKKVKEYVYIDVLGGKTMKVERYSEMEFHYLYVKALTEKYPHLVIAGSTAGLCLKKSQLKHVKGHGAPVGMPDIFIHCPVVEPDTGKLIYAGAALELKKVGGKARASQRETLNKLALSGKIYCAVIVSDVENGMKGSLEVVENYLDPNKHHLLKKAEPKPIKVVKKVSAKKPSGVKKPTKTRKTKSK